MKKEFNKIVENFIQKSIERKSEYLLLTNRSNDVTIFKTNQDIENTVKNVIKLLDSLGDKDRHTYLGEGVEDIKDYGDHLTFADTVNKEKEHYYLFDYTGAVIESV